MSETPQTPTPETPGTPTPETPHSEPSQHPETPAPQEWAAVATPAAPAKLPLRDRLPSALPAIVLVLAGTLFGALLTGGVVMIADDDHDGPRIEDVRYDRGQMGGDQFGGHLGGPGFGR